MCVLLAQLGKMRPSQILAAVVAMSSVTHAMTDAFDNIHGLTDVKNVLFGRQNDGMSSWFELGRRRILMIYVRLRQRLRRLNQHTAITKLGTAHSNRDGR